MDKLTDLYLCMQNDNVFLIDHDMSRSQTKAASMKILGDYAIFVDYAQVKTLREELCLVAHECGHVATGAMHRLYSPLELISKHEYRADRWATLKVIPFDSLCEAFKNGYREVWSLAEYFDVTEEFMRKSLEVYTRMGKLP